MDKKYVTIISAVAVACVLVIVLTGFSNSKNERIVENLIYQRSDILQNMLLGKISIEEGEDKLRDVELGNLYSDDIRNVYAYRNSDYDIVTEIKIISLNQSRNVSDVMNFEGEIEWTVSTNEGLEVLELSHNIGVKRTGDVLKLVSFEPVKDKNLPY